MTTFSNRADIKIIQDSTTPRTVQTTGDAPALGRTLIISYHNGDHYNSVCSSRVEPQVLFKETNESSTDQCHLLDQRFEELSSVDYPRCSDVCYIEEEDSVQYLTDNDNDNVVDNVGGESSAEYLSADE